MADKAKTPEQKSKAGSKKLEEEDEREKAEQRQRAEEKASGASPVFPPKRTGEGF